MLPVPVGIDYMPVAIAGVLITCSRSNTSSRWCAAPSELVTFDHLVEDTGAA